jgi:hypothetical protein
MMFKGVKKNDRVAVPVYLNRETHGWLRAEAFKSNLSMSEIIRRAIKLYQGKNDGR